MNDILLDQCLTYHGAFQFKLSITIQKTGSHNFEKYAVRGHASSHESGLAPAAPHSPVSRLQTLVTRLRHEAEAAEATLEHGDSAVCKSCGVKILPSWNKHYGEKLLCVSLAGLIMGGQVMKKHPLNDDQLCGQ